MVVGCNGVPPGGRGDKDGKGGIAISLAKCHGSLRCAVHSDKKNSLLFAKNYRRQCPLGGAVFRFNIFRSIMYNSSKHCCAAKSAGMTKNRSPLQQMRLRGRCRFPGSADIRSTSDIPLCKDYCEFFVPWALFSCLAA